MTKEEFLQKVNNTKIKDDFVKKIEEKYNNNFPDNVKKLLSISDTQLFFGEERRYIGSKEIENASEELHVDFVKKGLIPIIDAYENDYICFNIKKNKWCFFNLNDESVFSENTSFENLL